MVSGKDQNDFLYPVQSSLDAIGNQDLGAT